MKNKVLRVFFLDVGQGDCTFIIPPGDPSYAILFDCHDRDVAERFVVEHGIKTLSAVVSHLDVDHIRGMPEFLVRFRNRGLCLQEIYLSADRPSNRLKQRVAACELLELAQRWDKEENIPLQIPHRGGTPHFVAQDEKLGWAVKLVLPRFGQIVGMQAHGTDEPNRFSVALRLEYANRAILIGGDVPLSSWERLEQPLLQSDVFRIPHHGGNLEAVSRDWSIEKLYSSANPSTAVASVGTHNQYGHPTDTHVGGLRRGAPNARLLCTQLTRRCHEAPLRVEKEALANAAGVFFPYRQLNSSGRPSVRREVPCAGSILVTVSPNGQFQVLPKANGWHQEFIQNLPERKGGSPRALCLRAWD